MLWIGSRSFIDFRLLEILILCSLYYSILPDLSKHYTVINNFKVYKKITVKPKHMNLLQG